MSDDTPELTSVPSLGGMTGTHPPLDPIEYVVAPSTEGECNSAHLRLIPIACWRVDDVRFRFDSSFPLFDSDSDAANPDDIRAELKALEDLVKANPGAPLSVFGHADPVGNDDYNKTLSGRRAMAIYGLLVRDTSLWDKLFKSPLGGDNWHTDVLDSMEKATGLPKGTPNATLFKSYMDLLCGAGFQLQKSDFLAQGADAGGKGDYQGCGEFNPVLLFSQEDQSKFDAAAKKNDKAGIEERNAANAPNRRVMVLLFRKNSKIDPAKWPCPRATEGVAGCKKRFWADGDKRRSTHDSGSERTFDDSEDTFACRFYQRISTGSPCHALLANAVVKEIDATVPATKAVRDPANKSRADNTLTPSTSPDESLVTNKPVVLVRGCLDVQLKAVTDPPGLPVQWFVKPNQNDSDAPTITPTHGGKEATLKSDKPGSFSVIAALGVSKIVWNVVFVWVKVDPATSNKKTRNLYNDNGSDTKKARFRSGEFKTGKFTWEASVKATLFGGGNDKKLGIDQVTLGVLQNGVADTLTGNYDKGGTCLELPLGGTPITDSNGNADIQPLLTNANSFSVTLDTSSADKNTFTVWTGDSPTGAFVVEHKHTHEKLRTISGINGFATAVASRSKNAPTAICLHAKMAWQADYAGDISYSFLFGSSSYKAHGANTSSKPQFVLISEATGGQDAQQAGFETFEPRFNSGTGTRFTP